MTIGSLNSSVQPPDKTSIFKSLSLQNNNTKVDTQAKPVEGNKNKLGEYIKDESLVKKLQLGGKADSTVSLGLDDSPARNMTSLKFEGDNFFKMQEGDEAPTFENTPPSSQPILMQAKGNLPIKLAEGVDLKMPADGKYTPEKIKIKHPETGKEMNAYLFELNTGDKFVVPEGQTVSMKKTQMIGGTTYTFQGQDGSVDVMRARYACGFSTRSIIQ
jgi:hypothetical protein